MRHSSAARTQGCNWQDRDFVYGVEGDVSFGDDIEYLASLRGRVGLAFDNLLIFLTAGVAFIGGDNELHLTYADIGLLPHAHNLSYEKSFKHDYEETGLVVGGGFEKKLDPNWSLGVEGLYYFFSEDDYKKEWVDGGEQIYHKYKMNKETDNDLFVVRGRLTYHINRAPGPIESYK